MMNIIYFFLLIIALVIAYAKYIETRGIYFPQKAIEVYPSDAGVEFEEVNLKTQDGVLINGWFIPQDKARYTLLFLHGNAGNISYRLEKINLLQSCGANVFIIDYRGFGKSQGRPSEKGFYLDARAAYDYLLSGRNILPGQIILYGESMGTAVSVDLASREKVGGVILEGAFSCGRDMARIIYPFMPPFVFSDSFNSLKKIKNVRAPKLFLHSKDDEIVPFLLAQKLYNASFEPKKFQELKGNHNNLFIESGGEYVDAVSSFVAKLDNYKSP